MAQAGQLEHCFCGQPNKTGFNHFNHGEWDCYSILGVPGKRELPVEEPANNEADDHNLAKALGGVNRQRAVNILNLPMVNVEVTSHNSCNYEFLNVPNEQAMRIVSSILPKVVELYLNKSRDYDGSLGDMIGLGPQAAFVDIWRKVGKLKLALWDGRDMVGEQVDEILADLVGHVLLVLDGLNQAK